MIQKYEPQPTLTSNLYACHRRLLPPLSFSSVLLCSHIKLICQSASPEMTQNWLADTMGGCSVSGKETKNIIMDEILLEILRSDTRGCFSLRFGRFRPVEVEEQRQYLKRIGDDPRGARAYANAKRYQLYPSSSQLSIMSETIDFNDESFSSSLSTADESNFDIPGSEEDPLKESTSKYTPGKNFQCPVKSCKKVYTSSYGLKYHMDHGHTEEKIAEKRPYACPHGGCGKTYKNNNGLKYHVSHAHKGLLYDDLDLEIDPSDWKQEQHRSHQRPESDAEAKSLRATQF